jgi:hypothetical protein
VVAALTLSVSAVFYVSEVEVTDRHRTETYGFGYSVRAQGISVDPFSLTATPTSARVNASRSWEG